MNSLVAKLAIPMFCIPLLCLCQSQHSYKPAQGYVPDSATAIKVAEAVLIPVYGEQVVQSERPFKAELREGVWTVIGAFQCEPAHTCVGGVASVQIAQDDGRILSMTHGK